jgi:hypothetical protein
MAATGAAHSLHPGGGDRLAGTRHVCAELAAAAAAVLKNDADVQLDFEVHMMSASPCESARQLCRHLCLPPRVIEAAQVECMSLKDGGGRLVDLVADDKLGLHRFFSKCELRHLLAFDRHCTVQHLHQTPAPDEGTHGPDCSSP